MNSKENILFNLIKNNEYDKLIQIIKTDNTIDINEVDETGIYLIQYAILFRQLNLVALLISHNCKLDILDEEGRSIFYIPIKFGYNEIISLLINFSNVVIGIPLLEIQDLKLNIPLHYAIIFNKYNVIDEILNAKSNINFKDIDGNTALHLITQLNKIDNINLIQKMIDKKIGLNHINNLGQTALHISTENNNIDICKILLNNNINIDIETLDDHLTALLISSIHLNINICILLLKYKPNINCQDVYGNSVLNHAILNKSKQIIELFYDIVDVNLINISGNISINLFFESDYEIDKFNEYKFIEILQKSKINIQNNIGKTTWHYLVQTNIWQSYVDILKYKKNKIFIQDINGISSFDIVKNDYNNQFDNFIAIIADSFYNIIIKNSSNQYNFNIDCIAKISTGLDIKLNNKSNIKQEFNHKSKSKCIEIIKDIIINDHISIPDKKKLYNLNPIEFDNIKFSTYTGITLDIVMGLIYLKNKFNNISTSLTIDFINNQQLENYYKINGIQKGIFSDFLNFEIIWSFQKLFLPSNLKQIINNFKLNINQRYLIIPIGIELSNGAHSNILLYDKILNEMERFEPYGMNFPPGFNYNPHSLDNNLKNLFLNYFKLSDLEIESLIELTKLKVNSDFKYYSPFDYQTKIGLQLLDTIEYNIEKNIGDPGGFCSAWSLWYIEMRLTNLNIKRNELNYKLINYIRLKRISFRSVIRSFAKNITDIRDLYLLEADIDINQWLNNNLTEIKWNKLIDEIKKAI